jgi:lipid-A-disaccharide synthase
VLPGSRPSEIERVLPAFEDAVRRLKAERPELHVVVPAAPRWRPGEGPRRRLAHRAHVVEGEGPKRDAMKAATVALACSGTVTTELALAGVPMVVGYRDGPVRLGAPSLGDRPDSAHRSADPGDTRRRCERSG